MDLGILRQLLGDLIFQDLFNGKRHDHPPSLSKETADLSKGV
jgi:hypothetical protein